MTTNGELVLVRHGRTEANARGLLLGRLEVDLDELGRRQATALADAVGAVDLVVTSPLRRARQTADAFGDQVAVEVDEAWVELDYGAWDGRPAGEVPDASWAQWRADPDFTPPGGESLRALATRTGGALDGLVPRAIGGRVVVVTHVSPVKAALAWALDLGPEVAWRTFVAPASITRIRVGAGAPTLLAFNETQHRPDR